MMRQTTRDVLETRPGRGTTQSLRLPLPRRHGGASPLPLPFFPSRCCCCCCRKRATLGVSILTMHRSHSCCENKRKRAGRQWYCNCCRGVFLDWEDMHGNETDALASDIIRIFPSFYAQGLLVARNACMHRANWLQQYSFCQTHIEIANVPIPAIIPFTYLAPILLRQIEMFLPVRPNQW